MRSTLAVAIALMALAPAGLWAGDQPPLAPRPGAFELDQAEPDDTLGLNTDKSRRMTINVSIGGKGIYPFIIDTGAQRTVISRRLAADLGLPAGNPIRIHSMGGASTVDTVVIRELQVNKLTIPRIEAPVLEEANMGAVGILGMDALETQQLLLDFQTNTITIAPVIEPSGGWKGDMITVTGRNRLGHLMLANASADGKHVDVIIDTGSQVSVGNNALRRRLATRRNAAMNPINLMSVTGHEVPVDYTFVQKLKIAGLNFTNLPVAFRDTHMFVALELIEAPVLFLGMDVLQLFDQVLVDFTTRKVSFYRSESMRAPPPSLMPCGRFFC